MKIRQIIFLLISGLVFCLSANLLIQPDLEATSVKRNSPNLSQAYNFYWQGKYQSALAIWEQLLERENSLTTQAQIHSYLGVTYRQIQQLGSSVRHFQESIKIYRQIPEEKRHLAEVLTEIARTYHELGQWNHSRAPLEEALALAQDDLALKSLAYRTLGTTYWLKGDFEKAIEACEISRNLASVLGQRDAIVSSLNDLTNVLRSRRKQYLQQAKDAQAEGDEVESARYLFLAEQDRLAAVNAATRAVEISKRLENLSTVRAMLNLSELGKENYRAHALKILEKLPPSRTKAELLMKLASDHIALISQASDIAQAVGALGTQSFALLQLGKLYEKAGQYQQALEGALRGQWIAQQIGASDSLYRLQWLSARVYQKIGSTEKAITHYRGAIATLQKLRSEIASASPEVQLDTKTEVEPVYRELLSLLLNGSPSWRVLHDSVEVMRQLQFSELQSFFGDACLELRQAIVNSTPSEKGSNAAIIHTILLENLSYTILELPDGTIRVYPLAIAANQFREDLKTWRTELENSTVVPLGYRSLSEKLYNLLIRPMELDLIRASVEELVFINDGLLRNVPMAALHDGERFLIEKYPISMSLGLNLKFPVPSTDKKEASIFGLSVAVKDKELKKEFPPLPYVIPETLEVQRIFGGDRLLDANFTLRNFAWELQKELPIVHVATHGEFLGTLESTFLRAYDQPIKLRQLEEILAQRKEPIDLLTLSACRTASGNERAILGLAGLALRSGVRNVVASLWSVNDKATTELIVDFFRYLRQGKTKTQALQKAQLKQLAQESHPSRWATFMVIAS
jgi:CHAT domain-containing protein